MRFQGQLDEDVLVNLLQYLHLNASTGVLRLHSGRGVQGEVYTERGQVVHAVLGDQGGLAALVALLHWKAGRFVFHSGAPAPSRTIDKPLEALLLEVAYRTDVGGDGEPEPVTAASVLAPVGLQQGEQGRSVALPLTAIRVLPLLDGVTPLSGVAAQLGLDVAEVVSAAQVILANDLARLDAGRTLDPGFIHNLTDLVRDIMGPLADIVMDESLDDLNVTATAVPEAQLPALLEILGQEFPEELRGTFEERLGSLLRSYGLEPRS